jgi:hypothetical protein
MLVLLLATLPLREANGAPAPFARPPRRIPAVSISRLAGTWNLSWGSATYTVVFTGNDYTAEPGHWVGTSCMRGKVLWLVETMDASNASGWRSYSMTLDPASLSGTIQTGSPGVKVEFKRPGR